MNYEDLIRNKDSQLLKPVSRMSEYLKKQINNTATLILKQTPPAPKKQVLLSESTKT